MRIPRLRCRWTTLALAALLGAVLAAALRPRPPAITLFPHGTLPAQSAFSAFVSIWSWKLQRMLFGDAKRVDVRAWFWTATNLNRFRPFDELNEFVVETNGVAVYLFKPPDARSQYWDSESPRDDQLLARPSISTADGVSANFFTGYVAPINGTNQDIGTGMNLTPRVRKNSTEIELSLLSTELAINQPKGAASGIQTNLALAARMRIPEGTEVLILKGANQTASSTGLVVKIAVKSEK